MPRHDSVYISTPIKLREKAQRIEDALTDIGMYVENPCHIEGALDEPRTIQREVYESCLFMMEATDCVVVVLDYFGRDCAWELGFTVGSRKPVYGVVVDEKEDSTVQMSVYGNLLTGEFDSIEDLVDFLK